MTKVFVGGLSLRLPQSESKEEFWQHLLEGRDLVTEEQRNWAAGDFGVPARYGKLCGYDKFDSNFFDVHPKQAAKMDPQVRMLLEVSYEAILDAGINPNELSGSNTGVVVGACGSDVMSSNINALDSITGYEASGCALSMFANRLSHHFDLKGPSLTVDTACSSALTAFDLAVKMIESGQCDRAIVGGASFIFHPLWTVCFNRLNMLSPDGKCKSFNEAADGFARSEGIVALVLTREDLAAKKYAHVAASGCNSDGFTEQGITYPNQDSQQMLLRQIYGNNGVDPNSIAYAETHGTGTNAGDPVELGAMEQVLFEELGRNSPLLVGSVKSNMGHAEGASGLAGIAKVLLSMQHGVIPGNLHAGNPKTSISGLSSGRFRINDSLSQFENPKASISSFGFGGSNAHIVLEMVPRSPTKERAQETPEWLAFPYSSQTQDGLERLGDEIVAAGHDPVVSAFLTRLHVQPIRKQPHRGMILRTGDDQGLVRVQVHDDSIEPRPVWFVCNGVGSQWSNMGRALPQIPATRELLARCSAHLRQHGLDLDKLLDSSENDDIWCDPTNIFVAIVVVQLAQVEALRLLNVTPSGFFGHSLGELVCAYLDGAVSLEQTLDIAFFRGQALVEAEFEPGAMAAVQTDLETLGKFLLQGIEVACHNGTQSFTVSGPAERIAEFAARVKQAGIPCTIIDSGGIPFHSSYIQRAKPAFTRHLEEIIKTPHARSGKWRSSSRQDLQSLPSDEADVEYFIDNLFKPVHFGRCLEQVPSGAIIIELGPCGLLRSQCRAGAPNSPHIALSKRKVPSSQQFWRGLAELGCQKRGLDWQALLGETGIENPVANLNELVHWDHQKTWELPEIMWGKGIASDHVEDFTIDLHDPENAFVKDHIVNGNPIFPGVGYLHLVWLTLAKAQRKDPSKLPVEFKDIRFVRACIFRKTSTIKLRIKIDSHRNTFTVMEGAQLVAEGKIASANSASLEKQPFSIGWMDADKTRNLQRNDVYRLFVKTGIEYGNLFRGISQVSADRKQAAVDWTHNWPTFFDAVLQLLFIASSSHEIGVPRSIGRFRFDPRCLPDNKKNIPASIESSSGSVRTPVVEIEDAEIHSNFLPNLDEVALHKVEFKAFTAQSEFDNETQEYLDVCCQLLLSQLHRIFKEEDLSIFTSDTSHLRRIESALGDKIEFAPPTQSSVEKFVSQPESQMLRLIRHLFERWQDLVEDAMPCILSYPEYAKFYREDRVIRNRKEILENMLDLVVRNSDVSVLRSIEIGAGTGALTSIALPYLSKFSVSYEISDISAGYFGDLAKEFEAYKAKTSSIVWDANNPAPALDAYDLIMGSNSVHTVRNVGQTLTHIAQGLKKGGFFLLEEMTGNFWLSVGLWGFIRDFWSFDDERVCGMYLDREGWIRAAREVGLELAMSHEVGGCQSFLLFRKVEQRKASVIELSSVVKPREFAELQRSLQERAQNETLWLVGGTTSAPGLDGFVRCLAQEPDQQVRGLFVDGARMPESNELERLQSLDLVSNVVQNEQSGIYMRSEFCKQRDVRSAEDEDTNFQLRVIIPGDLGSIRRVPDWTTKSSSPKAYVRSFPLNFKDAMLASGRISSRTYKPFGEPIGLEYAGELKDGTRVMGLNLSNLGISQVVTAENYWTIPPGMSFEAACTIPVAYATAYAGIALKGRASQGQSVFIHSGAGAVGQAAIVISMELGLEIYTTVGSDSKREFLLDRFPTLKESNILDSRSNRFKSQLHKLTNGHGVDIVLNSLSGEGLLASLGALAKYGHFIDISRYDAFENHQLPMKHFLKNITYASISLDEMYRDQHPDTLLIHEYIQVGLDRGVIQPISYSQAEGVRSAVEELLRGETIGKLVLNMKTCQSSTEALHIFHCSPDKQYLVTGGLGGVGIEFCQWLLSRGAKRITIATRSSDLTAYQQLKVSQWRAQGAQVDVTDARLSDPAVAEELVRGLEKEMPLGGIFHLAMTLREDLFSNLTFADFELPIQVKVFIGNALDCASRKHCSLLDHFVVFSSGVAFYGNEGQSSYAYANSALERLCEQRHRDGLPSVAIQWGALGDVGFVARNKMENSFGHLGMKTMSLLSMLNSLDTLLLSKAPVVSAHSPIELVQGNSGGEGARSLLSDILEIVGFEQMPDEKHTLADLGVDSLMIVEIIQILSRDYGLALAPKQVRELTLSEIRKMDTAEAGGNNPDPNKSKPTVSSALEQIPTQQSYKRVIFYFDGLFLDPSRNLQRAKPCPETAFIEVPYHHPGCDLDGLTNDVLQQALQFDQDNVPIEFFGFSFGGILASVVRERIREQLPAVVITCTCAALPQSIYIGSDEQMAQMITLVNNLGEHVSTIEEAIAALLTPTNESDAAARKAALESLLSSSTAFEDSNESGYFVSYAERLHTLLFFHRYRALWALPSADRIVVFSNDPLSIDKQQAEELSTDIHVVEAQHDSGVVMHTLLGNRNNGH